MLVFGSGLAVAPSMANDCVAYMSETGPGVAISTSWLPYGTRCEGFEFLGPSSAAFTAWLTTLTVILGVGVWRRVVPAVRGAGIAVCVVGAFGLIGHQVGGMIVTFVPGIIVTAPLVFALDAHGRGNIVATLTLSATLPFAAVVAYTIPWLAEAPAAGVACAALIGAVLSVGVETLRVRRGDGQLPFIPTEALFRPGPPES